MKSNPYLPIALIGLFASAQAGSIQRIPGPVVSANAEPILIDANNDANDWLTSNPAPDGNGLALGDPGATGTYYFGFNWTINNNNAENGGGGFYAGLWFFENNTERPAFGNGWSSQTYEITGPGGDSPVLDGSAQPVPYVIGQTVRVVGKVQLVANADDILTMWVNPVLNAGEGAQTGVPTSTTTRNMEFNNVRARTGQGSGQTTFAKVMVATDFQNAATWDENYDVDSEPDGMKDGWERLYPGMLVGVNDASGNLDGDGLSNLLEFQNDTNPVNPDTDGDTLTDGQEVNTLGTSPTRKDTDGDTLNDNHETNTGTYVSATNTGTDPLDTDTDSDGYDDGLEVAFGSDPTKSNSIPNGGDLNTIGTDGIDYEDGPIANRSGGTGFDFDNTTNGNLFIGHTGDPSNWDSDSGNPQVLNGQIVTQESAARREFNSDQGVGQVNGESTTSGQVVYLRADLTLGNSVTYAGLSSLDFFTEKVFVGVPAAANPVSGKKEFALTGPELPGVLEYTGIEALPNQAYTLVLKIDYAGDLVSLFVNPNLAGPEPAANKTAAWTSGSWTTALRIASGGTGSASWDKIVAARAWAGLNAFSTGSTTTYAAWIGGFPQVGSFTGISDDFDNDGLDNGIEQILGGNPTVFTAGPAQVTSASGATSFTHSRTNIPATDLTATYEWSTNLTNWYASGAVAPGGLSVNITSLTTLDQVAPANDVISVTATPAAGTTGKLFVRVKAVGGL